MSRQFRGKEMQMASKHVMSHSICPVIRKMQIKIKNIFCPTDCQINVKIDNSE